MRSNDTRIGRVISSVYSSILVKGKKPRKKMDVSRMSGTIVGRTEDGKLLVQYKMGFASVIKIEG